MYDNFQMELLKIRDTFLNVDSPKICIDSMAKLRGVVI